MITKEWWDLILCLDVLIDPLRVSHVLQHDFAHLQRSFPKSNFEDFNISSLQVRLK